MNAKMELIVDNFAGGGGASTGIEWATGRSPDIAINHDAQAVAMHAVNHPSTRHLVGDIWDVRPREVCAGRPVGLAWFSPDCKHFSKAKGGKPVEKKIRGLAWVVIRWAREVKPRVIFLENVEEFADWGPLLDDGKPCPARRGLTFRRWLGSLRKAGYEVDMRELRACDFGAPTIRKRLFVIARRDGLPIVWPAPTHGRGLEPHRTAADCIDWSLACQSIFERSRPLAEKTLRRIARGVWRYVIDAADPFIVPVSHAGDDRVHSIREPLRTHRGEHALVSATVMSHYGESVSGGKHALVSAFLAKHYGGVTGQPIQHPLGTVTTVDHHSVVAAHMLLLHGSRADGQPIERPLPTVRAGGTHLAEVRAFLARYNGDNADDLPRAGQSLELPFGTLTTTRRFGLVTVRGEEYAISDIGLRMLSPRELFRAQGFPETYVIDPVVDGKPLTKEAQVRMCGNSVSPPVARALVEANIENRHPSAVTRLRGYRGPLLLSASKADELIRPIPDDCEAPTNSCPENWTGPTGSGHFPEPTGSYNQRT